MTRSPAGHGYRLLFQEDLHGLNRRGEWQLQIYRKTLQTLLHFPKETRMAVRVPVYSPLVDRFFDLHPCIH